MNARICKIRCINFSNSCYTRTNMKGILLSEQADNAQSTRLVILTKNINFVGSTTPPYTRYTFAQN